MTSEPPATAALHSAAAANDVAGVRRHLAGGVPLEARDAAGSTALHVAVRSGALDAAGVLVEAGADLEARVGPEDLTPLHLAALSWRRSPDGAMIALLRGYEAVPYPVDAHGLTPADVAARHAGAPPALVDLLG